MSFEEKTIKSETIYEGKVVTLKKDKVQIRGGKVSYREIIRHRGAVALLPITEDGKVILVEQYRKPIEKVLLEIPAGKMEIGESPISTAARELEEETGYSAKNIELITKMLPAVGYSDEVIYIYVATGLTPGETNFDEGEDIDIVEVELKSAVEMVMSGEIEDGKTIVALMMYQQMSYKNNKDF